MPIRHFLVIFDSEHQRLIAAHDVGVDRDEAMRRYEECEREYGLSRTRIQIVLIGADSLETVKRTHSQYFSPSAEDPFADLVGA
jgi:type II secretory pathway predicted ATPase ExeA